jgi:hypothetical protein
MKVNRLLLLGIPLLFLSEPFVNANPVGDFFKKVGQSMSKPFQSEPQPPPQPAKTPHVTRRSTSRAAPAATATPSTVAQPSQPPQEEKPTDATRGVSTADMEKAKASLPYGVPVPGRKGMVISPYAAQDGKYVDVTGFASGSIAKDPYTGKLFLVP